MEFPQRSPCPPALHLTVLLRDWMINSPGTRPHPDGGTHKVNIEEAMSWGPQGEDPKLDFNVSIQLLVIVNLVYKNMSVFTICIYKHGGFWKKSQRNEPVISDTCFRSWHVLLNFHMVNLFWFHMGNLKINIYIFYTHSIQRHPCTCMQRC